MLNLSRKVGEGIYIGDSEFVIKEITNTYVLLKFEKLLHLLNKRKPYEIVPGTKLTYHQRKGSEALLYIDSKLPVYRTELYLKRKADNDSLERTTD